MRNLICGFFVAMGMTVVAQQALASFIFNPALTYRSSKTEATPGGTSEGSTFSADFKAGFLFPTGLYLGGFYSHDTNSVLNQEDDTASSLAASVGYFKEGFLAMLSYHFMGTRDSGGTETKEGTGPQFDIGYVLPVNQSFHLGPQFRWRSLTYTDVPGATTELKVTQIDPMFSLWFMF